MEKVKQFIANPLYMLLTAMVFFGLAFVDSIIQDASGFGDLTIFGKVVVSISMAVFAILMIRGLILPVIKWLVGLVK